MELTQRSLVEELIMTPDMDNNRIPFPTDFFTNSWRSTPSDQLSGLRFPATYPSLVKIISPQEFGDPSPFGQIQPLLESFAFPDQLTSSFYDIDNMIALPLAQQDYATNAENREFVFGDDRFSCYKVDSEKVDDCTENLNIIINEEKRSGEKKTNGLPSKNLMAERRRRRRLSDRLSMLRSIVPKITKMDRISILGDAIDYTRELIDKIHKLREEGVDDDLNKINLIGNFLKELKPNEMLVKNPQKFDVQRRINDTKIEVCCAAKPGLLVSTLGTLDALGLDIQQCAISCFNDFSLQASCYEVAEHRSHVCADGVKQTLLINAGYGGRCL